METGANIPTLSTVAEGVRDRMPKQCKQWVRNGDCYIHQEFMLQNCRESCMAGGSVNGEYIKNKNTYCYEGTLLLVDSNKNILFIYLLFIIYYLLLITYYLLFIIYYLLFIIYYLLFIIFYLLFIIYYLLFIIYLFICRTHVSRQGSRLS